MTFELLFMADFWQDLLQKQIPFPDKLVLQDPQCFIPLANMGIISVTGDDAESFLQNLLTNDVSDLSVNQAQRSGFCTAKGRLFALFILIRRDNGYQIMLPKNMVKLLQQRLSMYILRSKVSISDESENMYCLATVTQNAIKSDNFQLIDYPNDNTRSIAICDKENIENVISQFEQQGLALAPQSYWEQLDIEQGLVMIWPETKELFTPQQINLDLVGGVSFSKGCYPGQEIVARLHYLGKPSRRLFIATANDNQSADLAEEIFTEDNKVAGHIVSYQYNRQLLTLLLSLKLEASSAALFLKNGTPLKVSASNGENS